MMPRLSRKRLCIENPPMPIKKNKIDYGYLKNYDKKSKKGKSGKKAYILQGKKLSFGATGVIHVNINLENLKAKCKGFVRIFCYVILVISVVIIIGFILHLIFPNIDWFWQRI